ncbi:MAG: starvation-sensing protein RspA [Actinobacteria bacterium]|nr:starvation-sensing protein RspA [Actinomycetota bacterium]
MAKPITITNVRTILTAPEVTPLVVVKIETSEPGLYGLGCATFTQRYLAVATAIDKYLKDFLIGKDVANIEDIWQTSYVHSSWRNDAVLSNSVSGIDMALWDIKGKVAGMPVYDLLGGKARAGAAVYRHADGKSLSEVEENVRKYMEQGLLYIRCQWGGYGGRIDQIKAPENAPEGAYFDPHGYARNTVKLFDHIRNAVGDEIELLHDVHERLAPIEAVRLSKNLEPYRLFFLEDALSPEAVDWFAVMRQQSATPIAMGELFTHPQEWVPLIQNRLIDFIRCHISTIGGITPAKKLAHLCEAFGIRTAWHGPGDVSPVGHAANLHIDLSSYNFGVQEWWGPSDLIKEVFPGTPELRGGYLYANDKPGLGIDIDEKLAAQYPPDNANAIRPKLWTTARTPDGGSWRP